MTINNVFIVGAGLMGSGIAQVCAQAGINVNLNDVSREALDKGLKNIAWYLLKSESCSNRLKLPLCFWAGSRARI